MNNPFRADVRRGWPTAEHLAGRYLKSAWASQSVIQLD